MKKILAIKIDEELYEELLKRSKKLGYSLIADYIRDIIAREIGYKHEDEISYIKEKIEKIEKGILSEELRRKLESIVENIIAKSLKATNQQPLPSDITSETKILQKLERKIQDLLNPWTSKIDSLAVKIAQLSESIEQLNDRVSELEKKLHNIEVAKFEKTMPSKIERIEPRRKRSAIERLKEQGVVFESDVQWLRDRAAFFDKLRREGAIVLEAQGERIAVDRSFWRNFINRIAKIKTSNEEDAKKILNDVEFKLFKKLREAGLIYFDSIDVLWKPIESIEEA